MAAGATAALTFQVKLPPYGQQGTFFGTAYQVHVGAKFANQSYNDADAYLCQTFVTCNPTSASSLVRKRVDGTAANGNTMIYWLDYQFFNSPSNYVTDV